MEYAVKDYGDMIADTVRMDAYVAALERAVTPGCVVVDIGTGTGVFALLACRFGAARVYAIEPSEVVEVARRCAVDNGFADRITFFQAPSEQVELSERADVVISDLRGLLPLYGANLTTTIDARARFLAQGGRLIPAMDMLRCGLVEAEHLYSGALGPWREHARGFDLEAPRALVANSFLRAKAEPAQLLGPAADLLTLDYATIESPNAEGAVELAMMRSGSAHGLCVWFDAVVADGIGFSNAPGETELVYGRALFPFPEPIAVAEGDRASVAFAASLFDDDYVFRWDTTVVDAVGATKASYRQSTLDSLPLSTSLLHRSSESHRPALDRRGEVTWAALELMDGEHTLGEIADAIAERFPAAYRSRAEALRAVTRLSQAYTR